MELVYKLTVEPGERHKAWEPELSCLEFASFACSSRIFQLEVSALQHLRNPNVGCHVDLKILVYIGHPRSAIHMVLWSKWSMCGIRSDSLRLPDICWSVLQKQHIGLPIKRRQKLRNPFQSELSSIAKRSLQNLKDVPNQTHWWRCNTTQLLAEGIWRYAVHPLVWKRSGRCVQKEIVRRTVYGTSLSVWNICN